MSTSLTAPDRSPVLPVSAPIEIVLDVQGMTCASCVNRIERYPQAHRWRPGRVRQPRHGAGDRPRRRPGVGRRELVRAVEAAGYEVRPAVVASAAPGAHAAGDRSRCGARRRAAPAGHPGRGLDRVSPSGIMAPHDPRPARWACRWSRSTSWRIIPATFIQIWAGGRFVRAALRAGRHDTVTMDTLVAIGTTAAWGYSVVVTLWPEIMIEAGLEPAAYFDSSTIIIGLILMGRWLEARARSEHGRRRAGADGAPGARRAPHRRGAGHGLGGRGRCGGRRCATR